MRDPKRIPTILAKIYGVWKRQPDTRLGQLLLNLCRNEPNWPDIFNVEDDKLLKLLDRKAAFDFAGDEINREIVQAIGNPNIVEKKHGMG